MSYSPLSDKIGNGDDPFQTTKNKIQNAVDDFTTTHERWKEMLETTNTAASKDFSALTDSLRSTYKDIRRALKELEKSIEYAQKKHPIWVYHQVNCLKEQHLYKK